jgi:signal peptidase I
MTRVHEVAKELGVTSQEVMAALDRLGRPVSSHASSIAPTDVEAVRAELGNGAGPQPGGAAPIQSVGDTHGSVKTEPGTETTPAPGDGQAVPPARPEPGTKPGDKPAAKPAGEPTKPKRRFGVLPPKKPHASLGSRIVSQIVELPILVLVAFLIAVVIKTFLVQAFYIPSQSMQPTLKVGDRVLVEKVSYLLGSASQGDVVVFARNVFGKKRPDVPWYRDVQNYVRELLGLPTGSEEDYIKRVAGVGGDVIVYSGSPRRLVVNGEEIDEPYIKGGQDRSSSAITVNNCKRYELQPTEDGCRVPAGTVFVMGDNRNNSADSRSIGPVDEDKIVGRAFVVIWPLSHFGGL